jgi:hypothetical protein
MKAGTCVISEMVGRNEVRRYSICVRSRITALAVSLLLPAQAGMAQAPTLSLPTETDLHAAYCTQVLKIIIEGSEASDTLYSRPEYSTVPGPNDPPELRASKAAAEASRMEMKALLDSQKAMLRKLDLYLKPRLLSLDPIPLVAAQRAAQEDWDRFGSATSACQNDCPMSLGADAAIKCNKGCAARAIPDLPTLQKKTMSCVNLEWLPF